MQTRPDTAGNPGAKYDINRGGVTVSLSNAKITAGYFTLITGLVAFGVHSAGLKHADPGEWAQERIATTR